MKVTLFKIDIDLVMNLVEEGVEVYSHFLVE